jgi:uncharacterized protein (TIGR02145 family)
MANIIGIVTDSAGVGIEGAVIKLENGGQLDTTESNGGFILKVGSTGINSQTDLSLLGKLFASIHNGFLYVTVAEKSTVEINTFDLNGKSISRVYQAMGEGSHSISLPYRSAGIYLYKVKLDNREFVLKGNSIGRVSSGNPVSPQDHFSYTALAKQKKTTAIINDVIKIMKNGYLNSREKVTNADTMGVVIKLKFQDTCSVTDIDKNVYHAIRIGSQVWTVENLRVTKYNDGTTIKNITNGWTWDSCRYTYIPAYCYYNNTNNADSIKTYGALYNWYVVNPSNTQKIAPKGWHIPDTTEWNILERYLIDNGYNWDGTINGNKIAKSMAAKTDWSQLKDSVSNIGTIGYHLAENNSSGFSAIPGGCRLTGGQFTAGNNRSSWRSATESNSSNAYIRTLDTNHTSLERHMTGKSCGFSIRLLRDN